MKALLLSAVVFFSLRAFSAEVGENIKPDCANGNNSSGRDAKVVEQPVVKEEIKKENTSVQK